MTFVFDGYNYTVRLERGERLSEALQNFFTKSTTDMTGASVSGVGAAERIELGYYDLESQAYQWRTFEGLYEIASLLGTFALDEHNSPLFHLHGTFSDRNYQVVGGHVKDFVVGGTCELFIHLTYLPLKRKLDPETGLKLLDI